MSQHCRRPKATFYLKLGQLREEKAAGDHQTCLLEPIRNELDHLCLTIYALNLLLKILIDFLNPAGCLSKVLANLHGLLAGYPEQSVIIFTETVHVLKCELRFTYPSQPVQDAAKGVAVERPCRNCLPSLVRSKTLMHFLELILTACESRISMHERCVDFPLRFDTVLLELFKCFRVHRLRARVCAHRAFDLAEVVQANFLSMNGFDFLFEGSDVSMNLNSRLAQIGLRRRPEKGKVVPYLRQSMVLKKEESFIHPVDL